MFANNLSPWTSQVFQCSLIQNSLHYDRKTQLQQYYSYLKGLSLDELNCPEPEPTSKLLASATRNLDRARCFSFHSFQTVPTNKILSHYDICLLRAKVQRILTHCLSNVEKALFGFESVIKVWNERKTHLHAVKGFWNSQVRPLCHLKKKSFLSMRFSASAIWPSPKHL